MPDVYCYLFSLPVASAQQDLHRPPCITHRLQPPQRSKTSAVAADTEAQERLTQETNTGATPTPSVGTLGRDNLCQPVQQQQQQSQQRGPRNIPVIDVDDAVVDGHSGARGQADMVPNPLVDPGGSVGQPTTIFGEVYARLPILGEEPDYSFLVGEAEALH
uniref:Uncharacterized protein n=1 Tax=Chromera velia CCMP2878 TaxID=1169474 RepID=A0A0G4GLS2_9ALVE|eukprot:Cvel_22445.t1-p1 / transcript=Cvel_22445.t1 / gene=Cvel_22445 / organism=Chromera_velia_CCMP2878 / gene_product=hypothetical protein / transcript_product=hypothetical protein / location=Cvel_scaffold2206:3321-14383(-) / protein_length=160 / sequence_SO=supercontig / SO=protein_coding / is_pseudo=false